MASSEKVTEISQKSHSTSNVKVSQKFFRNEIEKIAVAKKTYSLKLICGELPIYIYIYNILVYYIFNALL